MLWRFSDDTIFIEMQNWLPAVSLFIIILWFLGADLWSKRKVAQRLEQFRSVNAGREYPNNYHIAEVGYYHATSGLWHERPWNTYREGQGYYWDGAWHVEPDQRHLAASTPNPGEVDRVNAIWFAADPGRLKKYNDEVEWSGFGSSSERTSGS